MLSTEKIILFPLPVAQNADAGAQGGDELKMLPEEGFIFLRMLTASEKLPDI